MAITGTGNLFAIGAIHDNVTDSTATESEEDVTFRHSDCYFGLDLDADDLRADDFLDDDLAGDDDGTGTDCADTDAAAIACAAASCLRWRDRTGRINLTIAIKN